MFGVLLPRLREMDGNFINSKFVKHRKGDGAPIYQIEIKDK